MSPQPGPLPHSPWPSTEPTPADAAPTLHSEWEAGCQPQGFGLPPGAGPANLRAVPSIQRLLVANQAHADARANLSDARPNQRLAIVTCMDARIDVFAALGLHLGEA